MWQKEKIIAMAERVENGKKNKTQRISTVLNCCSPFDAVKFNILLKK